jgi:hypothetical protein
MIFDTEALIALVLEFKRTNRPLQEFELLLYEATCDYLTKELRGERIEDNT